MTPLEQAQQIHEGIIYSVKVACAFMIGTPIGGTITFVLLMGFILWRGLHGRNRKYWTAPPQAT
jgi:hypothetical protein